MSADEAKAALCAHLGIADHGWAYIVGQVEGRIIPAPQKNARNAWRHTAPTEPGVYDVRGSTGDGDVMELMADGRWRFVQDAGDARNPSDPLPFVPAGVFTRLPDPRLPTGTLELPLGR